MFFFSNKEDTNEITENFNTKKNVHLCKKELLKFEEELFTIVNNLV